MGTQRSGARLIIVCGLPGAGKTTLARELESLHRAIRFSPDEWLEQLGISLWDEPARAKVEALQWSLGRQLLELGQAVIVEWGTWSRAERDALRIAARSLGAAVELHCVTALPKVLFERLQQRAAENPPVTMEQLEQWADAFEAPTQEELAQYDDPQLSLE